LGKSDGPTNCQLWLQALSEESEEELLSEAEVGVLSSLVSRLEARLPVRAPRFDADIREMFVRSDGEKESCGGGDGGDEKKKGERDHCSDHQNET
jgi:hypothetical protein